MASVENNRVINLSKSEGNMQWPGIVKVKKNRLKGTSSHVYDVLDGILPLTAYVLRAREIDTQEDYENAMEWCRQPSGTDSKDIYPGHRKT